MFEGVGRLHSPKPRAWKVSCSKKHSSIRVLIASFAIKNLSMFKLVPGSPFVPSLQSFLFKQGAAFSG